MLDKRNFYINGKWVKPTNPNDLEVINPSTEEACAVISLGSKVDTDIAVAAAKQALENWRESSKDERISLLEKLLTIYKKNVKRLFWMCIPRKYLLEEIHRGEKTAAILSLISLWSVGFTEGCFTSIKRFIIPADLFLLRFFSFKQYSCRYLLSNCFFSSSWQPRLFLNCHVWGFCVNYRTLKLSNDLKVMVPQI